MAKRFVSLPHGSNFILEQQEAIEGSKTAGTSRRQNELGF